MQPLVNAVDLSPRASDRILKVSRTIADLASFVESRLAPVAEAVGYRSLTCVTGRKSEFSEMLLRLRKFNIFWVG